MQDPQVNHPAHYTQHPSGVESIEITALLPGAMANVAKYVMRYPYKGESMRDLRKAEFYASYEVAKSMRALRRFWDTEDGAQVWEKLEHVYNATTCPHERLVYRGLLEVHQPGIVEGIRRLLLLQGRN